MNHSEIKEELQMILNGKSYDALISPIIYATINAVAGLKYAIIGATAFSFFWIIRRFKKKQKKIYAISGFLGVLLASGIAYFSQNAKSYFLSSFASNAIILLVGIASLLISKPLAAWLSHITRGWPIQWYWHKNVKPAYMEVTLIWCVLLLIRLYLKWSLYKEVSTLSFAIVNLLLGTPAIILILTAYYILGVLRLKVLKGPSVKEFKSKKKPPWEGQKRGF